MQSLYGRRADAAVQIATSKRNAWQKQRPRGPMRLAVDVLGSMFAFRRRNALLYLILLLPMILRAVFDGPMTWATLGETMLPALAGVLLAALLIAIPGWYLMERRYGPGSVSSSSSASGGCA